MHVLRNASKAFVHIEFSRRKTKISKENDLFECNMRTSLQKQENIIIHMLI